MHRYYTDPRLIAKMWQFDSKQITQMSWSYPHVDPYKNNPGMFDGHYASERMYVCI